jgi:hemerythrin
MNTIRVQTPTEPVPGVGADAAIDAQPDDVLEWDPSLCTSVPVLDEHHRALFAYLGHLERATKECGAAACEVAVDELRRFALHHFSAEEQLMALNHYPHLREHMAEHAAFTAKLLELRAALAHRDIARDLTVLLRTWLREHVAKSDMDFLSCIEADD